MGSGSSQPTTTTVNQNTSSLPAYAQPYYMGLMNAAQGFTDTRTPPPVYGQTATKNADGSYSFSTAAAPYDWATPGQRIAGFTQQQQGVQNNILNQQMPGQFQQGSGLAATAGLGSLTAGQRYAMQGGPQSFTQDGMAQQYMSPYMQNAVDVQKAQAIRDAQQGQLAQNLGAARQGTYGGARQLLASTERERNLGNQLGQIQATGQQAAYDNAVKQFNAEQQAQLQNQQFGANLGLQGLAQANQAAQTLGNLGATQQQTQQALLQQQQGAAAQQQALQQQYLDTAYQDYQNQLNYPMQQLQQYSSLLHGVPVAPNTTTTVQQPSPSVASQLLGTGLAGLSAYNMVKGG